MAEQEQGQRSEAEPEPEDFSAVIPSGVLQRLARNWLEEDAPGFDVGGHVVGTMKITSRIYCKQPCILAGLPFAQAVFRELDCRFRVFFPVSDGIEISLEELSKRDGRVVVAEVTGEARNVLLGERPALNCLARASGIATQTNSVVRSLRAVGWKGALAATRKTTPGFRVVEKYAVLVGGGDPHRYDLSTCVMLKDNHIDVLAAKEALDLESSRRYGQQGHNKDVGSNGESVVSQTISRDSIISQAIGKAKRAAGFTAKVEVEARSECEAFTAAKHGADIVMLDNFTASDAKALAQKLKQQFASLSIELSGGISPPNVLEYADANVDVISMGALTQGYPAIDFSMKYEEPAKLHHYL